jgi:hypothetical protein
MVSGPRRARSAALAAVCLLRALQAARAQSCSNAAADSTCAIYLQQNGHPCSHELDVGLNVSDLCQEACGACGLANTSGNPVCWYDDGFSFDGCCDMSLSSAGNTSCWSVGGRTFESCCLNLDPCRQYECGHYGSCVLAAANYTASCQCESGYYSSSTDGDHWCDSWGGNSSCWSGIDTNGVEKSYDHCCNITSSSGGNDACWDTSDSSSYELCQCADPKCRLGRPSDCPTGQECLVSGSGSGQCVCAGNYSSTGNSSCNLYAGGGTDPCSNTDCGAHGRCVGGSCSCDTGWQGTSCSAYIGHNGSLSACAGTVTLRRMNLIVSLDRCAGDSTCWSAQGVPEDSWASVYNVSFPRALVEPGDSAPLYH